jgi:hypothetical protein
MENATIVTLGSPSNSSTVSNFEEAFGEFSEARGRGRARRQKRKLSRIEMKSERRRARQKGRAEQQQARQSRLDERKQRKLARKEMGESDEPEEETTSTETEGASESDSQATPQSEGGQSEDGYQEDSSSEEEWGGSAPEDESAYDESGFDGIIATEDYFSEFNDEGRVKVSPKVKDVTRKIEWNKELVSRLKNQRAKALKQGDKNAVSEIDSRIFGRMQRVAELENDIANYSNASGRSRGRGREVLKAKAMARKERMIAKRDGKKGRFSKLRERRRRRMDGGSETPIDSDLNPSVSSQRIEIPAGEKSSATGLNGLDLANDFDAPDARFIELTSNVEGDKKMKINWTGVAIGVGVVAILYIANKKYKFLGK